MEKYLCHNGEFINATQPFVDAQNRSFKYGDGLFETMVLFNGVVPFLAQHYQRLTQSMELLQLTIPSEWNLAYLQVYINELLKLHPKVLNGRIRLMVYRAAGGHYTPSSNQINWLLSFSPLKNHCFLLNEKGLKIAVYPDLQKPMSAISHLKTNNALLYTLAGLYAQKQGLDDCLILNNKQHIAEAISSNICVVKRNCLLIPPVSDGGVAGIMVAQIKQYAASLFVPVISTSISPYSLENANEIWLTNAVKGIQWVGNYKGLAYSNRLAQKFVEKLNEQVFTHHKTLPPVFN